MDALVEVHIESTQFRLDFHQIQEFSLLTFHYCFLSSQDEIQTNINETQKKNFLTSMYLLIEDGAFIHTGKKD